MYCHMTVVMCSEVYTTVAARIWPGFAAQASLYKSIRTDVEAKRSPKKMAQAEHAENVRMGRRVPKALQGFVIHEFDEQTIKKTG